MSAPDDHGDGVALNSASHPRGSWWSRLRARWLAPELRHGAIEDCTIELPLYAMKGETVTCENGHPICDFLCSVAVGETQDLPRTLGNWRQEVPIVGQIDMPYCAQCGADFVRGPVFHFADGWRTEGRK